MKEDERGVWIACDPIEGTWVTPFATEVEAWRATRGNGREVVFVPYGKDLHDVLYPPKVELAEVLRGLRYPDPKES